MFDQYLRTTKIPAFEYKIAGPSLSYRWVDVVPGFNMSLRVAIGDGEYTWLRPSESWQSVTLPSANARIRVDDNFYVTVRNVAEPERF